MRGYNQFAAMQKRKPKRNDKSQCQRFHAKKRALKRYGLRLNRFDLKEIAGMIAKRNCPEVFFVEKQTNRVSVFNVKFRGEMVQVVYDKLRKTVVSFLPKENLMQESETDVSPVSC